MDEIGASRAIGCGRVIDIGTGVSTSVKKVAELVIELTGSNSKIEYKPLRTGEVKVHTKAKLTDAEKHLDWKPKTDLREGLKKTIPYYAKLLGLKSPTFR